MNYRIVIELHNERMFRAFVRGEATWDVGQSPQGALGMLVLSLVARGTPVVIEDVYHRYMESSQDNAVTLAITESRKP